MKMEMIKLNWKTVLFSMITDKQFSNSYSGAEKLTRGQIKELKKDVYSVLREPPINYPKELIEKLKIIFEE